MSHKFYLFPKDRLIYKNTFEVRYLRGEREEAKEAKEEAGKEKERRDDRADRTG